jgi:hypothetical protein
MGINHSTKSFYVYWLVMIQATMMCIKHHWCEQMRLDINGVMGMNMTKFIRLPNQNENKGMLNSKSKSWNKKIRTRTWHVRNSNPQDFIAMKKQRKNKAMTRKHIQN